MRKFGGGQPRVHVICVIYHIYMHRYLLSNMIRHRVVSQGYPQSVTETYNSEAFIVTLLLYKSSVLLNLCHPTTNCEHLPSLSLNLEF